jgi:hypothetical protein
MALLAVGGAFADAPSNATWATAPGGSTTGSTVDFDLWMGKLGIWPFSGGYPYSYLTPTTADNNGNGILDATEFALITAICNNLSHPLHDQIHEALKANAAQLTIDLGGLAGSLVPTVKWVMAAYVVLGDGSYTRKLNTATPPVEVIDTAVGSWGVVAVTIEGMASYGSGWFTGAPADANYQKRESLMSVCGDADSDGVNNAHEYYGQSMNRTAYVNAALNAGITTSGTGPGPCAGNNDTCLIPNVSYVYDAANSKVYLLTPTAMTWQECEAYAQALVVAGTPMPSHLVSINSAAENAFCLTLAAIAGDRLYVGASDAAVEDEWRWLDTGEQFWQGKAAGSAVGGAYTNWNSGEPNGDTEDYMEFRTDGKWNDVSGASLRKGLIEIAGVFPDANSNGIPDAFEALLCGPDGGTEGAVEGTVEGTPEGTPEGTVEGTVEGVEEGEIIEPCVYEGVFNTPVIGQGPTLANALGGLSTALAQLLAAFGMTQWDNWDIEHLEQFVPPNTPTQPMPGDGLPDSWEVALVEYCLCHPNFRPELMITEDFLFNKDLFATDCAQLAQLDANFGLLPILAGDLFPALLGSSAAMRDTFNNLFLMLTGGFVGLPSVGQYRIYGPAKAAGEIMTPDGDLDNDGLTNGQEAALVTSVGGGRDLFVVAATSPDNLWPGNPMLPVGGLIGLGLLAGAMALGGARLIRKK